MCVRLVEGIYAPELGQCHLQVNHSPLSTRVNLYVFPHPYGLDRAKKMLAIRLNIAAYDLNLPHRFGLQVTVTKTCRFNLAVARLQSTCSVAHLVTWPISPRRILLALQRRLY